MEEYVDCGLLQRGFALVGCKACPERRLVAFSCGSRSFCLGIGIVWVCRFL